MISLKTNTKLPIPAPKCQESAPRFSDVPAKAPDDLSLPAFLDVKKNPEPNTVSALAAKVADPDKRAAIEKIEAEKASKRETKRAVKKQVRKAKATGATAAMPLSGKDAEKAIKAARKKNTATEDKSGGKAAVRAAAKKTVASAKSTRSLYDWESATLKAKTGTVPTVPPFASYGPHMKKTHDMAKAGQAKELREYLAGFTSDPCPPSRKNLFRYGELCLAAIKGAASGGTGKRV